MATKPPIIGSIDVQRQPVLAAGKTKLHLKGGTVMTEVVKDGVKQLNVRIPSEIVEELKQYSETTGVPLGRIVTDALVAYRPTLKERAQALTLKAKAGKS